ncbi:MAG: FHA domain-containing protein [Actinomycetota bacterium]|nr:FHA domain-containing protein [Actinomycetota bacterium]
MSVEAGDSYLEVWQPSGVRLVPLTGRVVTIGKSEANTLRIETDPALSRAHAVIEQLGLIWCIRDLGSRNGTSVNGKRVTAQQALHPGDEIRVGRTRLVLRVTGGREPESETRRGDRLPELTRREHDVLVALCRPLVTGGVFREPASTKEIAAALTVSEAAVKQHLLHLYDKFGIYGASERRRIQLANDAVARGAVAYGDLGPGAT